MNETQKIEFVISYCDQLFRDYISQEELEVSYLSFKEELKEKLEVSHSIPNHKVHRWTLTCDKIGEDGSLIRGIQKHTGIKRIKLSRATLSHLKMFARFEMNNFLRKENRV